MSGWVSDGERGSRRDKQPGVLVGVRQICQYTMMGPQTFYQLHRSYAFPAMRLPDGRWCTSKSLIDDWIRARWEAQRQVEDQPPPQLEGTVEDAVQGSGGTK